MNHLIGLLLLSLITTGTFAADLISAFRKNTGPVNVVIDYEKYNTTVSNILRTALANTNQTPAHTSMLTNLLSPSSFRGKETSAVELVSFWDRPNIVGAANAFRKKGYRAASAQEMLALAESLTPEQFPVANATFFTVGNNNFLLCLNYDENEKRGLPEVKAFNPTDWTLIRMSQWAFVKTERAKGDVTEIIEIDGRDGHIVGEWHRLELTMLGTLPKSDAEFFQFVKPRISNYLHSVNGQILLRKYNAVGFKILYKDGKVVLSPEE